MRKILASVLALAAALTLCSCTANKDGYRGEITVWVADEVLGFTTARIDDFKAAHPEYADMTVVVEPVGEGDAANNMIADVEGGADVYSFPQDQLARLVASGALVSVDPANAEALKASNDAGSVAAATLGDTMYAYPMTSDNGYFLYYDTSVVTDPATLDGILAQCEAAGKRFYMEINSGWYQPAFFFGAGCTLTYDVDAAGNPVACNVDYASGQGVDALKAIIALSGSPAFVNGSSASNASSYAAIVSGVWDSGVVREAFGENYAAAKLPTFTVDGRTCQLGGFGGYKLMGVKPQTDPARLAACDALAAYLTSEEVQTARCEEHGWGPSNLAARQSDAVRNNPALTALSEQLPHCIPQGQYPGDYWTLATALGDSVLADTYDDYTDEQLLGVLQTFQNTCLSYVTAG